jgi:hypothetical protein
MVSDTFSNSGVDPNPFDTAWQFKSNDIVRGTRANSNPIR